MAIPPPSPPLLSSSSWYNRPYRTQIKFPITHLWSCQAGPLKYKGRKIRGRMMKSVDSTDRLGTGLFIVCLCLYALDLLLSQIGPERRFTAAFVVGGISYGTLRLIALLRPEDGHLRRLAKGGGICFALLFFICLSAICYYRVVRHEASIVWLVSISVVAIVLMAHCAVGLWKTWARYSGSDEKEDKPPL